MVEACKRRKIGGTKWTKELWTAFKSCFMASEQRCLQVSSHMSKPNTQLQQNRHFWIQTENSQVIFCYFPKFLTNSLHFFGGAIPNTKIGKTQGAPPHVHNSCALPWLQCCRCHTETHAFFFGDATRAATARWKL